MTIVAAGNTSILKPDCPCCEPCPCHVYATYCVRGVGIGCCDQPMLSLSEDCHGQSHSAHGQVDAWYNTGDTVELNADETVYCPCASWDPDHTATFVSWRITPVHDEWIPDTLTYYISGPLASVTLRPNWPCGFIACAIYELETTPPSIYSVFATAVGYHSPGLRWALPTVHPEGFNRSVTNNGALVVQGYAYPAYGGPNHITASYPGNFYPWHGAYGCTGFSVLVGILVTNTVYEQMCSNTPWCSHGTARTHDVTCLCDDGFMPFCHPEAVISFKPKRIYCTTDGPEWCNIGHCTEFEFPDTCIFGT